MRSSSRWGKDMAARDEEEYMVALDTVGGIGRISTGCLYKPFRCQAFFRLP
jgi:hypothetical protein